MKRQQRLPLVGLLFSSLSTSQTHAHGTIDDPVSRVHKIYLEGPESPDSEAARAAIAHAGGTQYYTWNQVSLNVANYNDAAFNSSYAPVIPDGKLASGNNTGSGSLNFSGMDLVSHDWDWPATPMTAGPYVINWLATAPHDPSFFKVWITTEGYDPKTALAWNTMEFLGKYDQTQYTKEGLNYRIPITLPTRTGRHVLYVAWQRIDPVGEVFFSTSDIIFDGGGGGNPDADPVISANDITVDEDSGTASISVTLSKPVKVGETANVSFATANGSATSPEDYSSITGTLTFAAGESRKIVSIPVNDDGDPEAMEFFTLSLSTLVGVTAGNTNAVITIEDDDLVNDSELRYNFDIRDDWGNGYNGWMSLHNTTGTAITNGTFIFSAPPGQALNVWGGPTSVNNGDGTYTVSNISIPANGITRLDLGFTNAAGGNRGPDQVTFNGVTLNQYAPSVSIGNVSKPEGNASGTVDLTITLSRVHDYSIHVSYQTIDGTATAPDDYTTSSGNLEFTAGEITKTITITHRGDLIDEADRSFTVALKGVTGETPPNFGGASGNVATVTLQNDDRLISFTATGGTLIEGDSGTANLTFRLFLDRAVRDGESVSIDYMAHGHAASQGSDFNATMGTYNFPSGATTGTIEVPVIGDTIDERHEWFNLHFSGPVGITMISTEATGQIIDNEFNPSQLGSQRVVAYLDGTSGDLNLPPSDRVTHIMYAFANLNQTGTLSLGDYVPDHLAALTALKAQNPNLKVLLSVGGRTSPSRFSAVASDPARRSIFANSCVEMVTTHNLDGIDVDLEWPGFPGDPGATPTPQDGVNYTRLLQALRTALDAKGDTLDPKKHYEVSAFTAASPAGIAALELNALAPIFDFVNAQGYNLHGPWNHLTGHNAGLHDNTGDPLDDRLNIDSILSQYLAGGFKRSQLLIGAPFHAQVFSNVGDTANGLFQPASNTGSTKLYKDMTGDLQTTARHWDAFAKVPYLYDRNTRIWSSYDDPQSMHEKALYSLNGGFGGIYFWRNGGDTPDHELLTAISDSLAKVDNDSDGIDDGWERSNFGDLTTANATSDQDKDRSTDLNESIFKTNPLDNSEFMKITLMTLDDVAGIMLQFPTKTGVLYQLQTSLTLDEDSWTNIRRVAEGTGQEMTLNDPTGSPLDEPRFYRIHAESR